jgi:hypothetical protein
MNVPQNETTTEIPLSDEYLGNPSNELPKNALPVGKFAGPAGFRLEIL